MTARHPAPTVSRLLELVDALAGQPVVMLADLVADRFITGTPKRISREAPVLILRYESETWAPGGGANAVANVASLGGEPLPLGVVGEDEAGRRLLAALGQAGVTTEGILERSGYLTPTKTRILGGGVHSIKQQIVRYDIEDTIAFDDSDRRHLEAVLARFKGRARTAILSDYGYGAVEPSLLPAVRRSLASGGTVLADSRYRLGSYSGLDGATPNEEEAETLLGSTLGESSVDVARAGGRLRDRLGARFLLVTRGSRGMALFEEDRVVEIPVHGTDQVADVTGAGDTVIGTFALALAAGASPLEAALLADYAGGVVVMKMGTARITREELGSAIESDPELLEGLRWARS